MWTVDDGSEGREQLFKAMDVIEKRREVREKLYHIHAVQRLISKEEKSLVIVMENLTQLLVECDAVKIRTKQRDLAKESEYHNKKVEKERQVMKNIIHRRGNLKWYLYKAKIEYEDAQNASECLEDVIFEFKQRVKGSNERDEDRKQLFMATDLIEKNKEVEDKLYHMNAVKRLIMKEENSLITIREESAKLSAKHNYLYLCEKARNGNLKREMKSEWALFQKISIYEEKITEKMYDILRRQSRLGLEYCMAEIDYDNAKMVAGCLNDMILELKVNTDW
jgi:hypothetical protein